MAYKGFNPVAFARTSATTLANHIREVEESMLRNFQLGALLESAGRVNYNNSGEGFDWPVQYRLHKVEGNTGETQRNFARRNLWKTASLEFRGYQTTDAMYYREFRSNKGPEGIVKVFDNFVQRLETSMTQAFGGEYYVDGSASGNEQSWHGLESMFVLNGTVNSTSGAQRSANAADIVGYPNDSYAALSTVLGNYGGENESGQYWPDGIADGEYDFWSPLVVNYTTTHADLPSSTNTWAGQGDEALRYAIINSQRNASKTGQITNILLARDLYMGLLNIIDDKERIAISNETSLRALGFKQTVNFDGIEVSWEAGIESGVGYGLNYDNIELKSMDESLLRSEGPEYDIHSQAFVAAVSTLSNLKFSSPRNFFKLAALA
ncbi:phage major capsid protein [uncultured Marinobacter sp.]|uniref:phage major capsid protein n=1 Tax=uncultured Marinobacter sp. TaxID=187379 RepID=UPI0030DBA6A4